jgi:hypothetical protein
MKGILQLTLLAPGIIETLLEGWQGAKVTLAKLMVSCPVEWARHLHLMVSTS